MTDRLIVRGGYYNRMPIDNGTFTIHSTTSYNCFSLQHIFYSL